MKVEWIELESTKLNAGEQLIVKGNFVRGRYKLIQDETIYQIGVDVDKLPAEKREEVQPVKNPEAATEVVEEDKIYFEFNLL